MKSKEPAIWVTVMYIEYIGEASSESRQPIVCSCTPREKVTDSS
jgi:hypothetical protein